MRPALRILSVLTLGTLLLSGTATPRPDDNPEWLGEGTIRLANMSPGMLFTADGVGVVIPPPGVQVGTVAILGSGTAVTYSVETTPDGSVLLHREPTVQHVLYQLGGDSDPPLPTGGLPGPRGSGGRAEGPSVPNPDIPRAVPDTVERVVDRLGLGQAPQREPRKKSSSSQPRQAASEKQTPESRTVEDSVGIRGVLGACVDGAYQLAGPKWTKPFSWYLYSRVVPSNISLGSVESALQRSVNRMVGGHNSCGLPDQISATASYAGRTTTLPDISTSGACGPADGKTELGFTSLPTGMVGMACWWSRSGEITDGDVVFNKSIKWYVSKPTVCVSQWMLEAAAAHELGHVFGLNHVSELEHGTLTMAPKIMSCQSSEVTLGLGDVKGLEALY